MADTERDIRQILGNQRWIKDALGELLANNSDIITNQEAQSALLTSMLSVLESIRDNTGNSDETYKKLDTMQTTLETMLDAMTDTGGS